ncbi:MAG: HAMP domain-containing histidine kinase [Actinobacteria bacterium]|nr:HAMP domain-containing histidine kinase [Actinomycetota bacterium]
MKHRFSRMGVRGRLLLAVLATVAVALIVMTVAFNYLLSVSFRSDADDRLRNLALDESSRISISNGRVTLPQPTGEIQEFGTQIWVFVSGATVSSPNVEPNLQAAAKSLDGQPAQYLDVPEQEVRLYGVPLYYEEERIGTIVSGLWMGSYNYNLRMTLLATGALALVLLLVLGFVGRWVLNAAFRPVSRMTAEAEAWSIADLDRRFEMGEPHDEVTQLASTLDGMLDRLAAGLRRERRFSAEVSHQLRTPLAKIKAEAELALRRERNPAYYQEALASVSQSADQMTRTVEALMAAAQEEGSLARGRASVWQVLEEASASVGVLAGENGVRVRVEPPLRSLYIGVERDIALQIIQPVVENACRFARSTVILGAGRNGKEVVFTVEDDGAGVTEEEKDRIFEPGVRGSAAEAAEAGGATSRGAGLGLSLARRLARAASGDVEVTAGRIGARFVVRLPTG